ncbi:MAG: trypsin-like serine protease [Microbacterium gubbeenense]|uniref:S1 family peptidase n=3 Tax=Microbacteriaceae TaxID=85023 RepID=UPI00041DF9AF|nr:S1 family peptidase [Microbacterium gubbeenense]
MHSRFKKSATLSAFGAAAALAASGLMVAPAAADDAPAPTVTVDQLAPQAFAIPGVVGVTTNGTDIFIKVDDSADGSGGMQANAKSADVTSQANALAAQFAGVKVVEGTIMQATSSNEVVGGAGIAMGYDENSAQGVCSVGFNAWSPEGKPAVLTAGHCVGDFTNVLTTAPSGDDASGGTQPSLMASLGTFGFSQFGMPGTQPIDPANPPSNVDIATDIAVIDNINPDLTLLPTVTKWGAEAAANDDLAADSVPVTSVAEAQIGEHLFRSGRTSGAYAGTVQERGVQLIGDDEGNAYPVYGFQVIADDTSLDFSQGGDSGGSVITDSGAAVGTVSGSPGPGQPGDETAWFADLPHALDVIRENAGDYQVMLDIAEPAITSATAERGGVFEGTAPANADVAISGDIEATVPADENGNFSFPAPDEVGSFDITLQATQGFNISDKVNETVKTSQIQVDAPAITSPSNESSSTSAVTEITGTGMPGATVELQGDAEGTAKVNENGNWSIATELGFGAYTVGATQSVSGVTSEARWVSFQVVPGAPTLVTPQDGATLDEGQLTAVVGESPIAGADVKVVVEGADGVVARGSATVDGGSWMAELSDALVPGAYTVKATQSIDGVSSSSVSASFEVVAAAGGGGGEEPTEAPTAAPSETPGPGGLAPTGADTASVVAPFAGGAAVILLAGITLLVIRRVKSA